MSAIVENPSATENPKEVSTENPKEVSTENPKEVSTENPKEVSTENPKDVSTENPKEVSNTTTDGNKENEATDALNKKIIKQIEYYFGNYNLPRDKFLSEKIKEDDGWIPMDVMLNFKRLSNLSKDLEVIFKALESSDLIEVNEADKKIRRSPENPLPVVEGDLREETTKRTIYCKGFPRDGSINLDFLLEYFKKFGPYETVHMRQFHDKVTEKSGFKGSVLVVFPDVEGAKEFMKLEDVTHKKLPILRKWHSDYLEEKKAEMEERKARKEARKEQLQAEMAADSKKKLNMEPMPKGTFLHASGFTNTTTREDIKAAVLEIIDDLAFIDFKKGNTEGYFRVATANSNKLVFEALKDKLKVNDNAITVRMVEGEEEDKQIEKAKEAKLNAFSQGDRKRKRQGGRGRGRGGHNFKRRRT